MAGHQDPNYVTENPFEGRGRAMKGNDFPDAGYGFAIVAVSSSHCSLLQW